PQTVRHSVRYLPTETPAPEDFVIPALDIRETAQVRLRPGSFFWDQAEFLARVARSRLKLTRQMKMNRRDLKAMEPAFGVQSPGYVNFLDFVTWGESFTAAEEDE